MMLSLPKYDCYKDSGVNWLGKCPNNWKIEKAKWIFKQLKRPIRKQDEVVTVFRDGQVTLRKNRRIEGFTNAIQEHGYQGIRKGDLVIHAMDAFARAIGVSDSDGKSTPVYSVCLSRDEFEINNYFYAYLLRYIALSGFILSLAKGIRERSTDFRYKDFAELLLPIPPLEEQEKIVKFLDRKCEEVEKSIELKQRLITLLDEQKSIVINQAVTKGLNPNAPMKDSGIDWLGDIPAHWEVKKLKYLAKIKYGLGQPPKEKENGLPLIRATNIERGKIVTKNLIMVDPEDIPYEREPVLQEDDIIVVRSGAYTADSALVTKQYEGAIAGYDMVATPFKNKIYPKYLAFCLLSKFLLKDQLYLLKLRAAQPHLNAEELGSALILLPSINEQKKIVEYLEQKTAEIEELKEKTLQQIEKLKELKQILIAEAVTGKIKV